LIIGLSLGQLLKEQRNAVCPIHDLVRDLLWQHLAAGHVEDHLSALPAGQAI
jgi:hypothetical protein